MHTQILLYNTNISECDFAFLANMKAALFKRPPFYHSLASNWGPSKNFCR